MIYSIFTFKRSPESKNIKFRWDKATIRTNSLEVAINEFNKAIFRYANVYLLMKTRESGEFYDNTDMNFLIIAKFDHGNENYVNAMTINDCLCRDYIKYESNHKKAEYKNNLKVAQQIEYCAMNRVPATFVINFIDKKYKRSRILFNTQQYYDQNNTEEIIKTSVSLKEYQTQELPRRFLTYNFKKGKFDYEIKEEEEKKQKEESVTNV